MDIESVLEQIGLTRNESLVYLTLIKIGTSKTGEILKKSGLNSGKIYEILESLKNKGLVSESVTNNLRLFSASPPAQILEYIGEKRNEISKEEEVVLRALPELERMRSIKMKGVKALTYTGLRGIKTAADEALDSITNEKDILAMGVTELKDRRFNAFWKRWQSRRIRKGIHQKMIFSERSSYFSSFSRSRFTQARVLDAITPATVDVFGDEMTLILNYGETPSCILIHDSNTARSFREFFNQLWKQAK
jgi:sugar-specific transcriptional regulator TrmB